ncbi:hypothetical protein ACS0TY_015052 [Phlomoides rotata]
MENKKMDDSSSQPSSFTDLFGVKDSLPTSASNDLFSSIFAASSTVAGGYYSTSKLYRSPLLDAGFQGKGALHAYGDTIKNKEDESIFIPSKKTNSVFQERPEPCPLSSSLYYGGKEDMYIRSSSPHTSGSSTNYKKDGGVDDSSKNNSNGVARRNWWQDRTRLPCPFLMDGKLRVWVLSKNLNCQVISFLSKTAFSATG